MSIKRRSERWLFSVLNELNLAGVTHPAGFYVDQDYLVTGEMTKVRENGAGSGGGVLATYAWDNLGRRASLTRGDGSVLSYGYDSASRLTSLADL